MSSKGSIDIYIYVNRDWEGVKDLKKRFEWRYGKPALDPEGRVELAHESDDASYLENEVKWLQDEITDMGIPSDKWTGVLNYCDYDCAGGQDGEHVGIEFKDGKISSFKQSETRMVECEPWDDIKFDTTTIRK